VPFGTPVIGYTEVSVFVVVVLLTTACVSFFLQILCGNSLIKEIYALAVVTRMECFASWAALSTIFLSFATALIPVIFLVHGTFAESTSTASPFFCRNNVVIFCAHQVFCVSLTLKHCIFCCSYAFAQSKRMIYFAYLCASFTCRSLLALFSPFRPRQRECTSTFWLWNHYILSFGELT